MSKDSLLSRSSLTPRTRRGPRGALRTRRGPRGACQRPRCCQRTRCGTGVSLASTARRGPRGALRTRRRPRGACQRTCAEQELTDAQDSQRASRSTKNLQRASKSMPANSLPSKWLLRPFLPLHRHVAFSHEPNKCILQLRKEWGFGPRPGNHVLSPSYA